MRKIILSIICILAFSMSVNAETIVGQSDSKLVPTTNIVNIQNPPSATVPAKATVAQCCDTVSMNSERLFYMTLTALNTMNYKIKEVQSKTGTVLFQAYSREFLVTIADKDSNSTFIKILPTDSNYSFSPALVQNIFGFLKANVSAYPVVL